MKTFKEQKLLMSDKKQIHLYSWDDVEQPKAVIQLVHGSCEHSMRYKKIAEFLNNNGYIVIANDHRGHGKTAETKDEVGFFGESNGWDRTVEDLKEVNDYIKKTYPSLPVIMLGHSMGSFLARHYTILYGETVEKVIFSGTGQKSQMLLSCAMWYSKKRAKKHGLKHKDYKIFNMSYKPFNKRFESDGPYGWLTHDKEVRDRLSNDELAFDAFTSQGYYDLFYGLKFIGKKVNINKTANGLEILFISGTDDVVGNYGKGVKKVYHMYESLGYNAKLKLYPHLRHEVFQELNNEKVLSDVLEFLAE